MGSKSLCSRKVPIYIYTYILRLAGYNSSINILLTSSLRAKQKLPLINREMTIHSENLPELPAETNSENLPELPADIWDKIMFDHSISIRELVRFSAIQSICKSIAKTFIPQQVPWLILNPRDRNFANDDILYCFNLLDSRVHEFEFPQTVEKNCVVSGLKSKLFGAMDGWVISRTWIFNPFTKEFAVLPKILKPDSTRTVITHRRILNATLLKVANAKGLSGLCVFAYHTGILKPALWTPNTNNSDDNSDDGTSWTFPISKPIVDLHTSDAIVYKGGVYELIYGNAKRYNLDLDHGTSKYINIIYSCSSHVMAMYTLSYLVELEGDLLVVLLHDSDHSVRIFKLDLDQVNWGTEWNGILKGELHIDFENNIQNIKNYAMFLGNYCSKSLLVTNFMSRFIRRNCIYFLLYGEVPSAPGNIGVFSLEDGSVEPLLSAEVTDKFGISYPSQWLMSMFCEDTLAPGSCDVHIEQLDVMRLVQSVHTI